MHWQILYQFSPIKQVITNDQRFMGLLSISYVCFQKPALSYTFRFFCICSVFGTIPIPPPSCQFFSFFSFSNLHPQPCFHKSYPQSKTFLNIRAAPGSAVFCSNAMLITIPSSSIHFFSFFDMLPSAPTTTGMTYLVFLP